MWQNVLVSFSFFQFVVFPVSFMVSFFRVWKAYLGSFHRLNATDREHFVCEMYLKKESFHRLNYLGAFLDVVGDAPNSVVLMALEYSHGVRNCIIPVFACSPTKMRSSSMASAILLRTVLLISLPSALSSCVVYTLPSSTSALFTTSVLHWM